MTTTAQPELPGSSGRTWAASAALSSTNSRRRPAVSVRSSAARASSASGIRSGATDSASRKPRIASPGGIGSVTGAKPCRFTYSWPSGKCGAARCAQCSARVVFPAPAVPAITQTAGPGPADASPGSPSSSRSSAQRPANPATAAGS
ncbi:hypothetical protein ACFYY1_37815 [Streptomyces sp. NPDC001890]|uniref:hypothetical protein n=1 Tax=Streptomyces sp. NPDC001890 TaxID=3364620 RepID=UPI00369016B4